MDLANEISEMIARMESSENPPSYEDSYFMLLRAMIEIRLLNYQIRSLKHSVDNE